MEKIWHDTIHKDEKGVIHRRNGSWCDVDDGPCSCGAWHEAIEIPPEALLDPIKEVHRLRDFLKINKVVIYDENLKEETIDNIGAKVTYTPLNIISTCENWTKESASGRSDVAKNANFRKAREIMEERLKKLYGGDIEV